MTQSKSSVRFCCRAHNTALDWDMLSCLWEARMREGRLRTGLRIAVSTAIVLSLALTANYLALAQPEPGQTSPAHDPVAVPPYPLEEEAVSEPPAALATPHTVACSESFGK